ncbi:MAG: HAMP domain-containing protein [Tessaracoccus sp.]|uniref:sensor histidine kinase n=1 Tax=Tessaracoccus sp. TaxID=1971211 RepID=UPI001EBF2C9E|nr:ATP-binding protein [Tessaracoccus sp.]MBK7821403.1 HAMP domain-containing protein [Tessaracoccus sp.]
MDRHVSIRARVISAVVLLTGLALLLSGVLVYLQAQASLQARVTADLTRVADEIALLAGEFDPATGEPFSGPEGLLYAAMQREVHLPSEGSFAVVDGRVRWAAPSTVRFRPEKLPQLVEAVLPQTAEPVVTFGDIVTDQGDVRYVVVPVIFTENGATGAMVHAVDMTTERAALRPIFTTYALVATGSLVLVAMLIALIVGRLLRPMRSMRETVERITETDISQRVPIEGTDDLSALAVTVNGMLDRLETAVTGQRELLDDVGHELRTPLTIVRGHLEIMDATDPEDVASSRALVIDELDRMRRLVDDLLTLAKSEQRDFVMPRPTDVARLTDETLAKATTLGTRHWVLEDLADIEAALDAQRISQAWLQLAANAVRYSAEGSRIGMGSSIDGDELRLWVRDEGVGIAAEEQSRVLERAERGRSGTGTGLGLAIVSSIARAHGGRVLVDSAEGVGTRVTIVVPVVEKEHA